MGLESILLAGQLRDQAIAALGNWVLEHTIDERLDALPLKTSRTWLPLHQIISKLALEHLIFREITEIQAQEQITVNGADGIPGYKDLICLATLLTGKKQNQTEAGIYFRNLAQDLPLLTARHQKYISEFTVDYVQARTTAQLKEEIPLAVKTGFSFNPDANTYNPFLAELSRKIRTDRQLQYALFTKWSGIEALEQITQKGVDGLPGFHHLISLTTILSGESRRSEDVGIYLKELAKEQSMPLLSVAHRDYIEKFDCDYVANTSKEKLCKEIPIIGKESRSVNLASHKYSPFLESLSQKILQDRKLQFAILKKISGIEAQEQITVHGSPTIAGYNNLRGLATLLRGTPGTVPEAGEYFRILAQEFNLPVLSKENKTYLDNFDLFHIRQISADLLLQEIRQVGTRSLNPTGMNYSLLFQQLAAKIGASVDLQLALTKKLGPLFTRGDGEPGLRTLNALLTQSMDLEERANIHVVTLRYDVDELEVDSLPQANKVITDYGRGYFTQFLRSVGLGKYGSLLGLLCFPQLLYGWVDGTVKAHLNDSEKRKCTQVNALKLARNEHDEPLSLQDYYSFVRSIFSDRESIGSPDVVDYVSQGDLSQVTILDEAIDPSSRNPNFRLRMFLATNPEISSNATLNAFVKFYSRAEERDLEIALNNYLHTIANVACVGKARGVQLGQNVVVQQEESGEYTYTLSHTGTISDRKKQGYGYALITPFVNFRNIEDELEEKEEIFFRVNASLVELHTKGMKSLSRIVQLNPDQKRLLEQHLQPVDYGQQCIRVLGHDSDLSKMVQALEMTTALTKAALQYPSFIHGDLHPRNIGLKKNDEVVFVDFEPEYSGIGAPQLDLAKLYSYKSMNVSLGEQEALVQDYMQRRHIIDEDFRFGFHAAVLYTTFVHMRYVVENVGTKYTTSEAASSLAQDNALLQQHAARMYGRATAMKLVELAQHEFRLT